MDHRQAQHAWRQMKQSRHILLINDTNIDGDTLGSTLAMAHVLKEMGKRVTMVTPRPLSQTYAYLPMIEEITENLRVVEDQTIDLVMSFDCSDGSHVTAIRAHVPGHPPLISFDHHRTNSRYGDINLVTTEVSSTAELVWRFMKEMRIGFNQDIATCLLTGICYDTTVFSNSATSAACFEAASELAMHGARVPHIVQNLYQNKSVDGLKVWGKVLERLRRHPDYGFVTTYIAKEDFNGTQATEEDMEGLSNFLAAVLQDDTVMVFRESNDGGVKASLRTISGNVAKLASWFPNGGGHMRAAGFHVPKTVVAQVTDR